MDELIRLDKSIVIKIANRASKKKAGHQPAKNIALF